LLILTSRQQHKFPKNQTGDYRYEDAQPSTTNSIEEQWRKVQEEQQKLKDGGRKK
jgi:hypothetical protein